MVMPLHPGAPLCVLPERIVAQLHQQFSHHNGSGCLQRQIMWQRCGRHASAVHNNEAAPAPFPLQPLSNTPHVGEEVLYVVKLQVLIAVCVGRQKGESTS